MNTELNIDDINIYLTSDDVSAHFEYYENRIVLPEIKVQEENDDTIIKVMVHEIFHYISRHNIKLMLLENETGGEFF